MGFLFDYQINYYSDSSNKTVLPFSVFALTQQGLDHQHWNIGNQDSGSLYVGKRIIIGALADGCSGGENINGKSVNQVGAYISSYLAIRITRKLLVKKHMKLNEDFLPVFEEELLLNYRRLMNSINPWQFEKEFVIRNFLLSTLIFFVVTEDEYLIANCGDGDAIVNYVHEDLNEHSGKYFATNLRNTRRIEDGKYSINPNGGFNLIDRGDVKSLNNIFIATDGFIESDIKEHPVFNNFFFKEFRQSRSICFQDKRTEFRKEFLAPVLQMKGSRTWPDDDATFISLKRNNNLSKNM